MSRTDAPGETGHTRRWRIIAIAAAISFLGFFDLSVINVMLPSIERTLGAGNSAVQWVVSGYALMFALALVPAGRFGDASGRRHALLIGLALFTVASAVAGTAGSGTVLVVARLAQGAAAGVLVPQLTALVEELFHPKRRGRPFGVLGATASVATAIGPVIGGLIIALGGVENGWRLVFLSNVPIGVVAAVLVWRVLPANPLSDATDRRPDLIGTLLLGTGIMLVLLPALQREQWPGPLPWLLLPAGIGVLFAFRSWETSPALRHPPVFDFRLLTHRTYRLGMLLGFFYYAGFTSLPLIFSLHLQYGLHRSPFHTGLTIAPFAVGSALGALLGGRHVERLGRRLIAVGLLTVLTSLALMTALTSITGTTFSVLNSFPLLLAGVGSGLVITPNNTLTLAQVPRRDAGSAAGMYRTMRQVGAAIGLAVITATLLGSVGANNGHWPTALRHALLVELGIVTAALLTNLADVVGSRRHPLDSAA
ncbi:MFS transporter [Salinispora vitiensis]|uniref:MFS transporter n=1 Tax=Salinispora vitiensis TaxID=999544 RepID=UPI00037DD77D|nr:MFS transporter [Salinispora vitiensis]